MEAVEAGTGVTSNTFLLLQSVGQLGELGGDLGHLVYVASSHHPVDVVHQLSAVGV